MATQEHLELSSFIKGIHSSLRTKSKEVGYTKAWDEHIEDKQNLTKYATSMKQLATVHWKDNASSNSTKNVSRIHWVYKFIEDYYHGNGIQIHRQKEREILKKLEINTNYTTSGAKKLERLELLDVGSCYNPFEIYDCFNIVAIDIAPACDNVHKCDFINVNIGSVNILQNNTIKQLKRESFHVIVFSLLLEYLPSPEQRLTCCVNAYNLLQTEGILIIITPDSKHVGANAKYMKSWRYVLSKLGFSRIKYEKLPYLHCMVFRKAVHVEVTKRWARLNEGQDFFQTLNIPQDFQINETIININNCNNDECNFLDELPFSHSESSSC